MANQDLGTVTITGSATVTAALAAAFVFAATSTGAASITAGLTANRGLHTSTTGAASITAGLKASFKLASTPTGAGTCIASAKANRGLHASPAGNSIVTASMEDVPEAVASLSGVSIFFIDPTKVTVIQFFRPTSVQKQYVASNAAVPKPQAPGGLPSGVTVGVKVKPPNSQTGGVPTQG